MSGYGNKNKKYMNMKEYLPQSSIKEVFNDNFEVEIKKISLLIENYPYISMDTEFPGIVYNNNYKPMSGESSSYSNLKTNVDRLKVIQVGITLADEEGNLPPDVCTWQFNFDFNLKKDNYSAESIQLLMNSGINFEALPERGISMDRFGEFFITSGLILNENVNWITFHGSYDFAYLLKIITAQSLPEKVEGFIFDIDLYFKNYFDVRYLVQYQDNFRGSLNKLAYDLNIERTGYQHQAGSDSLVTSKVYFKLLELSYLSEEDVFKGRNQLYCLNTTEENSYQEQNYYNGYNQYNIGNMNGMNGNMNGMNNMNNMNMGYQTYDNNFIYNMNNNYQYYNNNVNVTLQNCSTSETLKDKNQNLLSNNLNTINTVGIPTKKGNKKVIKEL